MPRKACYTLLGIYIQKPQREQPQSPHLQPPHLLQVGTTKLEGIVDPHQQLWLAIRCLLTQLREV